VLLDGHDIKEYDPEDVYAMFGVVFQDFGKYAVTAAENIEFGDVEKSGEPELVQQAAEQSGADSFIQKLPLGYDTPLMRYFEATGIELSIGQWQKLSIARAFYADSDILILDEPTASLDPLAEQEIFQQFNTLRSGKTSVFISHRLSSATIADQILVMENGEIIVTGTHAELMAMGGRYCELFTVQAERYQLPAEETSAPVRSERHT
jgi:ABC-type multidrug transport system fused ATPase/permease subunit